MEKLAGICNQAPPAARRQHSGEPETYGVSPLGKIVAFPPIV
jgi:hypothetical protein